MSDYRPAQKKAADKCCADFRKAAKAHRDKGDIASASAVLDEMKVFLSKPAVPRAASAIVCQVSGKVLGVSGKEAGAEAQMRWVVPVPRVKGAVPITGKSIGVGAKPKAAGARILIWSEQREPAQRFSLSSAK
ncbi:MAG: hypothetical protein K2W96_28370 [Gemmataceae bacterium]|nr:hypothetical protein [Gemmataceae bacterium]